MIEQILELIVDESKWFTFSMGFALLCVAGGLYARRDAAIPVRRRVLGAMNLFFAATITTMAFGHFLAVTTKLLLGTLEGPVVLFSLIGVAIALPSVALLRHALRQLASGDEFGRTTLVLNGWLAGTLVLMGLHNIPLAAPALFNVSYQLYGRRSVGLAIVAAAIILNVGLFIGSLIFLASGQSFEQFQGWN